MAIRRKPRVRQYRPQSAEEAIRYLSHAARAGLVTCAACVVESDLTARPRAELIASICARCRASFGRKDERWLVVPKFAVNAA